MQSLKHIQNQLLALQAISEMIFRQITTPQVLFWRKATLLPISLLNLHRALKQTHRQTHFQTACPSTYLPDLCVHLMGISLIVY